MQGQVKAALLVDRGAARGRAEWDTVSRLRHDLGWVKPVREHENLLHGRTATPELASDLLHVRLYGPVGESKFGTRLAAVVPASDQLHDALVVRP